MRLSCDQVEPMIAFLLDSELAATESQEVKQHLASCEACGKVFEGERRLRLVVRRAAASVRAPEALRQRLQTTMRQARRGRVRPARAWPVALALVLFMLFVWHRAASAQMAPRIAHTQAAVCTASMAVTAAAPELVVHGLVGH